MFLPSQLRILMIGVYVYVAWKFLTLGGLFLGAGILRSLSAELDGALLLPTGAFLFYVGMMAIERLRQLFVGPRPRF